MSSTFSHCMKVNVVSFTVQSKRQRNSKTNGSERYPKSVIYGSIEDWFEQGRGEETLLQTYLWIRE